jgi:hypothetical protein
MDKCADDAATRPGEADHEACGPGRVGLLARHLEIASCPLLAGSELRFAPTGSPEEVMRGLGYVGNWREEAAVYAATMRAGPQPLNRIAPTAEGQLEVASRGAQPKPYAGRVAARLAATICEYGALLGPPLVRASAEGIAAAVSAAVIAAFEAAGGDRRPA